MKDFMFIWFVVFVTFMAIVGLVLLGVYIYEHFTNNIWFAIYIFAVLSALISLAIKADT